ncbi:hypothetical protein ACR2R6_13395 [Methylocaldum gracile subsp. desertum]|uniref:hypothetical protein n=1 Tax=Methylocaldum sp. GT1BW TaxID=3438964 RepID=UPI003DA072C1
MGQTKFAQRAKARDGFGQLGSAELGPKNEPQGRGEHKIVGNGFGLLAAGQDSWNAALLPLRPQFTFLKKRVS